MLQHSVFLGFLKSTPPMTSVCAQRLPDGLHGGRKAVDSDRVIGLARRVEMAVDGPYKGALS